MSAASVYDHRQIMFENKNIRREAMAEDREMLTGKDTDKE